MYTRRDIGRLALGAIPAALRGAMIDSTVSGIHIGLQTYVFTVLGLPQEGLLDMALRSMVAAGIGECDLFAPLLEPPDLAARARAAGSDAAARAAAREELAGWRRDAPLDYFRGVREKFAAAGVRIWGYSGAGANTEADAGRTFDIAGALGAELVTLAFGLTAAKRIAPLAEARGVQVGVQGNPSMNATNADTIAKPEDYDAALAISKNYSMSFDIGDATGGGYDSLKFVRERLGRTSLLYIKDRTRARVSMPWGQGETPVREVLQAVRDSKAPVRCYIDCDYKSEDRPGDVKRSFEFIKAALA